MALVAGSAPPYRITCSSSHAVATRLTASSLHVYIHSMRPNGAQPRCRSLHNSTAGAAAEVCVPAYTAFIAPCQRTETRQRKAGVSQQSAAQLPAAAACIAAADAGAALTADRQQQHQRHKQRMQQQEPNQRELGHSHLQQNAQLLPLPGYPSAAVGPGRPLHWQQQQQQQQQHRLMPHPFCTLDPPILTYRIKQCKDWHDAAVLFAQQSQCMNHINCAAMMTHLAQLGTCIRTRPVNWRSFVAQVLATSKPQLSSCSPRQLSNMVWGLATLGYNDWTSGSSSWTAHWQEQLQRQLPTANCRDIANILWAVATSVSSSSGGRGWAGGSRQEPLVLQQQQHVLSDGRLQQELLSALHRELPNSSPQDVSNTLWALATLHLNPTPELQQYLVITAQAHSSALKLQEVAQILWAVAQLKIQPPTEWFRELLLKQVSHGVGGELKQCGGVGGKCQQRKGVTWQLVSPGGGQQQQKQQQQQQQQVMAAGSAAGQQKEQQQYQTIIAKQQRRPNGSHISKAQRGSNGICKPAPAACRPQRQQHGLLAETNPQNVVVCLVACAQLRQMPPDKWLQQALARLEVLLLQNDSSTCTSSSSSSSNEGDRQIKDAGLTASGSPGPAISPAQGAVADDNTSSNSSSSSSFAQDLSNTIWALGSLGVKPDAPWINSYLAFSAKSLRAAKPQELCNTIWGLARLGVRPDPSWLQGFDAATSACMFEFTAQGLADLVASQVSLGIRPSGAWKETWVQGLKQVWGSADAAAMCKTLWAAARLHIPLGKYWLSQSLLQGHEELQRALIIQEIRHEELLRLIWAVGKLSRGALQQSVSDMLGLHCCRAAAKMSWQQLQRAAQGLRKLRPLPRQQLVCYFCDLAGSRISYMPAEQGSSVGRHLHLLRVADEQRQLKLQKQQTQWHLEQALQQALLKQQQQQQQQQQHFGKYSELMEMQQQHQQQQRQEEVAVSRVM